MNALTKTLLFTFGLMAAAVIATNVFAGTNFNPKYEETVYQLYQGDTAICSSVGVEEDLLVTAAHCVTGPSNSFNIRVKKTDDYGDVLSFTSYSLSLIEANAGLDTAILRIRDKSMKLNTSPLCNSDKDYRLQTPLFAIGYPRGAELTITKGEFTARTNLKRELGMSGAFYKTTVPIMGGNSGGGLFAYENGQACLTGLATAGYNDVSFQTYFSVLDSVKQIYNKYRSE